MYCNLVCSYHLTFFSEDFHEINASAEFLKTLIRFCSDLEFLHHSCFTLQNILQK